MPKLADMAQSCGCGAGRRCDCGMSGLSTDATGNRLSVTGAPTCGVCDSCVKNAKKLADTGKMGKRVCKDPPYDPSSKEPCEQLTVGRYDIDYQFEDLVLPLVSPLHPNRQLRDDIRERSVVKYRSTDLKLLVEILEMKATRRQQELGTLDRRSFTIGGEKGTVVVSTDIVHSTYKRHYHETLRLPYEDLARMYRNLTLASTSGDNGFTETSFAQDVELEKARTLITRRLDRLTSEIHPARDEYRHIEHIVEMKASALIQAIFRSFIARDTARAAQAAMFQAKRIRAACMIERVYRGAKARQRTRRMAHEALATHKYDAVLQIQCFRRAIVAARELRRLRIAWTIRVELNACVRIQAWWRGRLCFWVFCEKLKLARVQRHGEHLHKSAAHMQRIVRGHLARELARTRRYELSLDDRVAELADEYISEGNMWAFLRAVNDDYVAHAQQRQREEELASTFVKHILGKREEEMTSAWDNWEAAKEKSAALKGAGGKAGRRHPLDTKGKKTGKGKGKRGGKGGKGKGRGKGMGGGVKGRTAEDKMEDSRLYSKGLKSISGNLGGPGFAGSPSPPGGGRAGRKRQRGGAPGGGTQRPYSPPLTPPKVPSLFNHGGAGSPTQDLMARPGDRTEPNAAALALQMSGGTPSWPTFGGGESGGGGSGGGHSSTLGGSRMLNDLGYDETTLLPQEPDLPPIKDGLPIGRQRGANRFPGKNVTRDVPTLNDQVDRFMLHAGLRAYVPPESACATGSEAFEMFLNMPPGLLKTRHEDEAQEFVNPYISILHQAGIDRVLDLNDVAVSQLKALGLPDSLSRVVLPLAKQLRASLGFRHRNTIRRTKAKVVGKAPLRAMMNLRRAQTADRKDRPPRTGSRGSSRGSGSFGTFGAPGSERSARDRGGAATMAAGSRSFGGPNHHAGMQARASTSLGGSRLATRSPWEGWRSAGAGGGGGGGQHQQLVAGPADPSARPFSRGALVPLGGGAPMSTPTSQTAGALMNYNSMTGMAGMTGGSSSTGGRIGAQHASDSLTAANVAALNRAERLRVSKEFGMISPSHEMLLVSRLDSGEAKASAAQLFTSQTGYGMGMGGGMELGARNAVSSQSQRPWTGQTDKTVDYDATERPGSGIWRPDTAATDVTLDYNGENPPDLTNNVTRAPTPLVKGPLGNAERMASSSRAAARGGSPLNPNYQRPLTGVTLGGSRGGGTPGMGQNRRPSTRAETTTIDESRQMDEPLPPVPTDMGGPGGPWPDSSQFEGENGEDSSFFAKDGGQWPASLMPGSAASSKRPDTTDTVLAGEFPRTPQVTNSNNMWRGGAGGSAGGVGNTTRPMRPTNELDSQEEARQNTQLSKYATAAQAAKDNLERLYGPPRTAAGNRMPTGARSDASGAGVLGRPNELTRAGTAGAEAEVGSWPGLVVRFGDNMEGNVGDGFAGGGLPDMRGDTGGSVGGGLMGDFPAPGEGMMGLDQSSIEAPWNNAGGSFGSTRSQYLQSRERQSREGSYGAPYDDGGRGRSGGESRGASTIGSRGGPGMDATPWVDREIDVVGVLLQRLSAPCGADSADELIDAIVYHAAFRAYDRAAVASLVKEGEEADDAMLDQTHNHPAGTAAAKREKRNELMPAKAAGDEPSAELQPALSTFKVFVETIGSMPQTQEAEATVVSLVQARTRASIRWAAPVVKMLKHRGYGTIGALADAGRALEALGVPGMLADELRKEVKAIAPMSVPSMQFDTRFQRFQGDPSSRPPPPVLRDGDTGHELARASGYAAGFGVSTDDHYEAVGRVTQGGSMGEDAPGHHGRVSERHRITVSRGERGKRGREWKAPPPAPPDAMNFRMGQSKRYYCRHDGCKQHFARTYTLMLHERTHKHAAEYFYWKKQPLLGKHRFPDSLKNNEMRDKLERARGAASLTRRDVKMNH